MMILYIYIINNTATDSNPQKESSDVISLGPNSCEFSNVQDKANLKRRGTVVLWPGEFPQSLKNSMEIIDNWDFNHQKNVKKFMNNHGHMGNSMDTWDFAGIFNGLDQQK
jgi:hypothetical protein